MPTEEKPPCEHLWIVSKWYDVGLYIRGHELLCQKCLEKKSLE